MVDVVVVAAAVDAETLKALLNPESAHFASSRDPAPHVFACFCVICRNLLLHTSSSSSTISSTASVGNQAESCIRRKKGRNQGGIFYEHFKIRVNARLIYSAKQSIMKGIGSYGV